VRYLTLAEAVTIAEAGQQLGIDHHLARVKPQVAEVLERDGLLDVMPREHVRADIASAVKVYMAKNPPPPPSSNAENGQTEPIASKASDTRFRHRRPRTP
jgi:hypothetical protein